MNVLFGPVRGTPGATEQSKESSARNRFCSTQVVNLKSVDFFSDWLMECGVRFYSQISNLGDADKEKAIVKLLSTLHCFLR